MYMSLQTDSRRDSIDGSLYVASKRHDDGPVANVVDRWTGEPLARPTTLMMGFHPSSTFSQAELNRVDGFLDYADKHLANRDLGPVVYTTLSAVTPAFSAH